MIQFYSCCDQRGGAKAVSCIWGRPAGTQNVSLNSSKTNCTSGVACVCVCVWSHYFPSINWNAMRNLHQLIYITAWGANQRAWYLHGCHSCTSAWLFWPLVFHFCLVPFITVLTVINSLVFSFLVSDVICTLIGSLTFCEDVSKHLPESHWALAGSHMVCARLLIMWIRVCVNAYVCGWLIWTNGHILSGHVIGQLLLRIPWWCRRFPLTSDLLKTDMYIWYEFFMKMKRIRSRSVTKTDQ